MKKVILILVSVVFLTSCVQNKKYIIETPDGTYATDTYSEMNGCIMFKSDCGCGGEPESVKACGNYTIKNNPNYEKAN